MIMSKYHRDVEYERYIEGHLTLSKYHDNLKVSFLPNNLYLKRVTPVSMKYSP